VQQVEQLGYTLKDFYAHHYNAFDGSLGPKVAESWTTNLQMLFEELGCTDEQKVKYMLHSCLQVRHYGGGNQRKNC
jgi:hypothetical protein